MPFLNLTVPTRPVLDSWELSPGQWEVAETSSAALRNKNSGDEAVIEAARALGQLQRAAWRHVGELVPWLGSRSVNVRRVVAWSLCQIGGSACAAYADIIVTGLGDCDAGVQLFLQGLLCSTGAEGAAALVRKIAAEESQASRSATRMILDLGSDGVAMLALSLNAPTAASRRRILATMQKVQEAELKAMPAFPAPVSEIVLPHLNSIAALLEDEDAQIRAMAAKMLGCCGAAAVPFAASLAKLVYDEDPCVRAKTVEALASLGSSAARHTGAIATVLWDTEVTVQLAALKALGRSARVSMSKNPLSHFDDGCWTLPDEGLVSMVRHLRDPADSQRLNTAMDTLKQMGSVGAALISSQLFHCGRELQNQSLLFLTQFPSEDMEKQVNVGAAALSFHLGSKDPRVRVLICEALSGCGRSARGHAQALLELSQTDPVDFVRVAALTAVKAFGRRMNWEIQFGPINGQAFPLDPQVVVNSVPIRERVETASMSQLIGKLVSRITALVQELGVRTPRASTPRHNAVKLLQAHSTCDMPGCACTGAFTIFSRTQPGKVG